MTHIVAPHLLLKGLRKSVIRLGLSGRLAEVLCSEWKPRTENVSLFSHATRAPSLSSSHPSVSTLSLLGRCLNLATQQLASATSSSEFFPASQRLPDRLHAAREEREVVGHALRRVYHHSSSSVTEVATESRECWSCHAEKPETEPFFCPSCGKIQPVNPGINYFALLSMDGKYPMDTRELEGTYKALQKRLHPDMFSTKSEEERMHSASQSAHVIKAYYTLLRPLDRAKYLLQLLGEDVLANDEGIVDSQDLLMEMMEVREEVEEAVDDAALQRIAAENDGKRKECLEQLTAAFERKDLKAAKSLMHRLTYLERIAAEILRRQ